MADIIVLTLGDQLVVLDGGATIPFHTWMDDISSAVNNLQPLTGTGTPEGNQVASIGRWYVDTSAAEIYFKQTGDEDTGWLKVS